MYFSQPKMEVGILILHVSGKGVKEGSSSLEWFLNYSPSFRPIILSLLSECNYLVFLSDLNHWFALPCSTA